MTNVRNHSPLKIPNSGGERKEERIDIKVLEQGGGSNLVLSKKAI